MQPDAARPRTHQPIMVDEVMAFFRTVEPGLIVDGTAGGGGHLRAMMDGFPETRFIAVDRDPETIPGLPAGSDRLLVRASSYTGISDIVKEAGFGPADAALFDLGLSSIQLDDDSRGFSHRFDSPLDMRFSRMEDRRTAADLLGSLTESEIADIIYKYGEEGRSRAVARAICAARPVRTTGELVSAVRRSIRGNPVKPLSRLFQALRIAVNDELGELASLLSGLDDWIRPGGAVAFITFHSIEDRMVKRFLIDSGVFVHADPPWVVPSREETAANPRARSARLRRGLKQ